MKYALYYITESYSKKVSLKKHKIYCQIQRQMIPSYVVVTNILLWIMTSIVLTSKSISTGRKNSGVLLPEKWSTKLDPSSRNIHVSIILNDLRKGFRRYLLQELHYITLHHL